MSGVLIRGSGIAALCCERLLTQSDVPVAVDTETRSRLPAILLSDPALGLIRDVFAQPTAFSDAPRITQRIVSWRPGEPAVRLPHSAILISEETLLESLRPVSIPTLETETAWTVYSSRPLPSEAVEMKFGSRTAHASSVRLAASAEANACWMEGLEAGWLFLIPSGDVRGWMLSVGAPAGELLLESKLVREQVNHIEYNAGAFPAYPRILDPLCDTDWLACGSAAMAFDPICGDGTANAVREAILAAAVIQAEQRGEYRSGVLRHYEMRLIAGFQKHLALTRDFYLAAARGPWWDAELAALNAGFDWCAGKLAGHSYVFALNDFQLVRRC